MESCCFCCCCCCCSRLRVRKPASGSTFTTSSAAGRLSLRPPPLLLLVSQRRRSKKPNLAASARYSAISLSLSLSLSLSSIHTTKRPTNRRPKDLRRYEERWQRRQPLSFFLRTMKSYSRPSSRRRTENTSALSRSFSLLSLFHPHAAAPPQRHHLTKKSPSAAHFHSNIEPFWASVLFPIFLMSDHQHFWDIFSLPSLQIYAWKNGGKVVC